MSKKKHFKQETRFRQKVNVIFVLFLFLKLTNPELKPMSENNAKGAFHTNDVQRTNIFDFNTHFRRRYINVFAECKS